MVGVSVLGLSELLDAIPDAALVVAPDGRIVLANERAATMFGYDRSTLKELRVEALVPEDRRAAHREHRVRYMAARKPGSMAWGRRLRGLRADGSLLSIDVSLAPLETDDGVLVLACVRDMTAYDRLLTTLEESEARYRQIVEGATEVFYRVSFEGHDPVRGRCEFVSPQCEQIAGRHPEEFLSDPELWFRAVHEQDVESLIDKTQECITDRKPTTRYYRLRRHPTGEVRWVADRITPVLDSEGNVVGYQGVARDITERHLSDEKQRQLELRLAMASKLETIGRLAGGVAHDFNNLLTVIIGGCDMAQAELDPESGAARELAQVADAARRAAELTRQLLAFSRRQVARPRAVSLSTHIRGMKELLRRTVPESISLGFSLPSDLWPVRIDPAQVDQIVLNLVVNARDAMPTGGALAVEAANVTLDESYCETRPYLVPGEYVRLSVRDTGHGMDAETVAHVFEPFFTTKPQGRGTGLGLASVYGIVKQNDGYIEVASAVGQGTAVVVYLPRSQGGPLDVPEPAEATTAREQPGTVLLVEDDQQVRHVTKQLLERLGYTVLEAPDPQAALAVCENLGGDIDLLLTDVVMPSMDGVTLSRQVKARRPGISVLYVSGYAPADASGAGFLMPEGSHCIQKPFDLEGLRRALHKALGTKPQA